MVSYIRYIVSLILLILILPGCIGFTFVYPKGEHKTYRKKPGEMTVEDPRPTVYWASLSDLYYIKKTYREKGVPESVEVLSSGEFKYTYKPQLVWAGIIVHVLIPIPLLIPVTKERYSYTIAGNLLSKEEALWTENVFCGLGTKVVASPIFVPICDLGCWTLLNRRIRLAGD